MYGIILDSMVDCIKRLYGDNVWQSVVGSTDISNTVFNTYKNYDEQMITMIAKATGEVTGNTVETIMEAAGIHFIAYIDVIRNDRITNVLGRTFKDFLNGLDTLHEYYRCSFTDIHPPSFQVYREDANGLELHYRSRRTFTGFMFYVKGLLKAVAEKFYFIDLTIQLSQHGFTGDVMLAVYQLNYTNKDYRMYRSLAIQKRRVRDRHNLVFQSDVFFELFPFHVVFDERLEILSTGYGLDILCQGLEGKRLNETFFLTRPNGYDLTWDNVLTHRNNVFELTSVKSNKRFKHDDAGLRYRTTATHITKLRGQMMYVQASEFVVFLATFVMDDLSKMQDMGIFVNDLTFHDLSRDMALHGPQQITEYKLALDLEQGKNDRLEKMIENIEYGQARTDDMLYSMIPKEMAHGLREGNTSVSLCEKHDDVTVLFSDVVDFANICRHIAPHEIVMTLNKMLSLCDALCKKHNIYKVETVADGVMCVSGAPSYEEHHTKNMADMAVEMVKRIETIRDPNTNEPIRIRIGLHYGGVIAGLVGQKIPRYCLFGDAVHIAATLEATSEPQRIQISLACKNRLVKYGTFKIEKKQNVQIKARRKIDTYWLEGITSSNDSFSDKVSDDEDDLLEDASDFSEYARRKNFLTGFESELNVNDGNLPLRNASPLNRTGSSYAYNIPVGTIGGSSVVRKTPSGVFEQEKTVPGLNKNSGGTTLKKVVVGADAEGPTISYDEEAPDFLDKIKETTQFSNKVPETVSAIIDEDITGQIMTETIPEEADSESEDTSPSVPDATEQVSDDLANSEIVLSHDDEVLETNVEASETIAALRQSFEPRACKVKAEDSSNPVNHDMWNGDASSKQAYNNLMRAIGLTTPLDVIVRDTCTILSARPECEDLFSAPPDISREQQMMTGQINRVTCPFEKMLLEAKEIETEAEASKFADDVRDREKNEDDSLKRMMSSPRNGDTSNDIEAEEEPVVTHNREIQQIKSVRKIGEESLPDQHKYKNHVTTSRVCTLI